MTDDPINAAENEMLAHASDTFAEALEVMHAIRMANLTGAPVWRWGTGDAFETLEAARTLRQFPPEA